MSDLVSHCSGREPKLNDCFKISSSTPLIVVLVFAGLVVSVKVIHGELEQATKENPLLLKNVCITKKLGFSDVIMPGDVR